jgi:lipopolysaccharide transport system permease protein
MSIRNLKSSYRDSLIGGAWMFIQPFTTALLWIVLQTQRIIHVNVDTSEYATFVLSGTLCWQMFCEGLLGPHRSIIDNKQMLTKVNVPPEGLLLSGLIESCVKLCASATISLLVISFQNGHPPGINGVGFFIGPALALLMGFSMGWIFAPPMLILPDLLKLVLMTLPFFMYLSPIVYEKPESGFFNIIMEWNPLTNLLNETRAMLLEKEINIWKMILIPVMTTTAGFFFGGPMLRKGMPHIIQQMGG